MTAPKDVAASVRARLLHLARERGDDFQLLLTRYANERLLFRLARSRHQGSFILKGATLFTLWTGHPHRATRDVDLLGVGDPSEDRMRSVFAEVIRATFGRRRTALPRDLPTGLSNAFAVDSSKTAQWAAFARKSGASDAADLQTTIAAVAAFVEAPLSAAAHGSAFHRRWSPGGPWA